MFGQVQEKNTLTSTQMHTARISSAHKCKNHQILLIAGSSETLLLAVTPHTAGIWGTVVRTGKTFSGFGSASGPVHPEILESLQSPFFTSSNAS